MSHGFPLNPLKPWRERIRCAHPTPSELRKILTSLRPAFVVQSLYLGLARSHHGDRSSLRLDHKLSVRWWLRSSAMGGIRLLGSQFDPICIRVRVHNCKIRNVPRGMHLLNGSCFMNYLSLRQVWELMLSHPVQSLFIGCFPMGAATLINDALVGLSVLPKGFLMTPFRR